MYFFGAVFLINSVCVAIFKKENSRDLPKNKLTIWQSYKMIWQIIKIKPVQILSLFLLTISLGHADEGVAILKLIKSGVSRDKLTYMVLIPLVPLNIAWPFIIARYTNGAKPLNIFFNVYPIKYIFILIIFYSIS